MALYCAHGRLPDFIIIGAAKSGTTTLYRQLAEIDGIFMSPVKEPAFFAYDPHWERGLSWYCSLFADAREEDLCGEASTPYSRCTLRPKAAERMSRIIPGVKLLYMLRHPVERAYSEYLQTVTKGQDRLDRISATFEEVALDKPWILDGSEYMMQIRRYLEFFDREQILLLLSTDMREDLAGVVDRALSFLGLDGRGGTDAATSRDNVTSAHLESLVKKRVARQMKRVPGVKAFWNVMPRGLREKCYRWATRLGLGRGAAADLTPLPMKPETREQLQRRYRPGILELSDFLGRDLSDWLE